MNFFKSIAAAAGITVYVSCVSTKVIQDETSLALLTERYTGKTATVFILQHPVECWLGGVQDKQLRVLAGRSEILIPVECVSKIRVDSGGRGTRGMVIGGLIGGALCGTGGWLAAREAASTDVNAIGHPVTLGMFVGGAAAGTIIGAGSKTVIYYTYKPSAEIIVLHEEVGEEITPAELKLFSLFDDLKKDAGLLLMVQIIRYGEGRFLLLYEMAVNTEDVNTKYFTKIKIVDQNYIEKEKKKIITALSEEKKD